MPIIDHKKGLPILLLVLVIFSITLVARLYLTSQPSTSSAITTEANYLSNEQSFFDIFDTSPSREEENQPNTCNCKTGNGATNTAVQQEQLANKITADIPKSLPSPPKELLDKINNNLLQDRVLIIATANYGMRNHVYNWIESLRRTGEEKFLIFCFDQKLYDHLTLAGYEDRASLIPDMWFHSQVESDFKTYFSKEYRMITHSKTLVVQQLLYLDVNVLFSDVDVVWLKPRMVEYLQTLLQIRPETHVLFQQEGLNQQEMNSGFYLMKPTTEMKQLLADTIYIQDEQQDKTQQGALNTALVNNRLDLDLRTGAVVLLDILHFPNGFVYYDRQYTKLHGIDPFIVHANYLVGQDKQQKLMESNMWYLDETWLAQMDTKLDNYNSTSSNNNNNNRLKKKKKGKKPVSL